MGGLGRENLPDERWFGIYGASAGAAVASLTNRDLVAEFAELVQPLEKASSKPLGEPGRSRAWRAFYEDTDGFRRLVAEAERRGTKNPLGLLLVMVAAGEHRLPETGEAA